MEKFSSIERVVGNVSDDTKEQIMSDSEERFKDQFFEELVGCEREKTPEELQIIALANEATNQIREKYGLGDFDIPSANIHVLTREGWSKVRKGRRGDACYVAMLQAIAVKDQPSRIAFMDKVFHEMIHLKSYNALQVKKGENPEIDAYRTGLTVNVRDGSKMYFSNINEALTEEITKRVVTGLLDHPLFLQEAKQTKNIIDRSLQSAVDGSDEQLFNEDTFYADYIEVEAKEAGSRNKVASRLFGAPERSKKVFTQRFTYQNERKILGILIDKILEKNLDKFQDREEVFEVFAKSMMTGNLLSVGRLVDGTFGSGTLRQIGELDQNIKAQEEFVEQL